MTGPRPLRFDPVLEARRQWEAHGWSDAAPGMAAITSTVRAYQIFLARVDRSLRPFEPHLPATSCSCCSGSAAAAHFPSTGSVRGYRSTRPASRTRSIASRHRDFCGACPTRAIAGPPSGDHPCRTGSGGGRDRAVNEEVFEHTGVGARADPGSDRRAAGSSPWGGRLRGGGRIRLT